MRTMLSTDSVKYLLKVSIIREELRRSALVATVSLFSDADTVFLVLLHESTNSDRSARIEDKRYFFMLKRY